MDKRTSSDYMSPARRALRALPEFVLMLAAVVGYGFVVQPQDPLLLEVNPHPFWAIILLITIRYGSPVGPAAGVICAALHVGGLWHQSGSAAQMLEAGGWTLTGPFLYIVVAFVVGESVESRIRRAAHVVTQTDDLRTRLAASEGHRTEMETAYRQLESRVAGQTNTFIALYDSARRLDSLEDKEILAGLLGILRDHLVVERCGIWMLDPDGAWHRVAPEGAGDAPLPKLGQKAAQTNAVVSASDLFMQDGLVPQDGLLAGPLRNAAGDAVGIVVIEAMSFVGFTRTLVKVFELLLDWASRARTRAQYVAQARAHSVDNAELNLHSETYLRSRAEEDLALAVRQKAPAALLLCRVGQSLTPEVHQRVIAVLARIFRDMTRASDCVAYFKDKPVLAMFLPDVTPEGADTVREKLERAVQELDLRPTGDDAPLKLQWGHAVRTEKSDLNDMIWKAYEASEDKKA